MWEGYGTWNWTTVSREAYPTSLKPKRGRPPAPTQGVL